MGLDTHTLFLETPEHTAHRAVQLAAGLRAGDVVLLAGEVGAGKTHFARAAITSLLEQAEDVPSPSFTLVQTYDTADGPIWHSDLYRVTSTAEIEELGLSEAFEEAICLVEWPDRLGDLAPMDALLLTFSQGAAADARDVVAQWSDTKWRSKLAAWIT